VSKKKKYRKKKLTTTSLASSTTNINENVPVTYSIENKKQKILKKNFKKAKTTTQEMEF
jgi:hypothetical protein